MVNPDSDLARAAPRLAAARARRPAAVVAPPAGARPAGARGLAARARCARRAAGRLRHRLPEVGPQPRPGRRRARRPARGARPDAGLLRRCSTTCAPPTRRWRSRPARAAGAGRPRGAHPHRPGLAQRHHRRGRAGHHPALDDAGRAARDGRCPPRRPGRPHHRPHAVASASARRAPSWPTWASSGTSPRWSGASARRSRPGWRCTRSCGRCWPRVGWCTATTPTPPSASPASWPRTAACLVRRGHHSLDEHRSAAPGAAARAAGCTDLPGARPHTGRRAARGCRPRRPAAAGGPATPRPGARPPRPAPAGAPSRARRGARGGPWVRRPRPEGVEAGHGCWQPIL